MPLPRRLRELVGTAQFWSDYFGDGVFEQPVAGLPEERFLELPLSRRHALRVGYFVHVGGENFVATTNLTLRRTDTGRDMLLGWHDAHRFPHALRWEEVDLIGRLQARRDPDLPHPGIPFLLLTPYVASIEGTDHVLGLRLLNRALRSLGVFTERQIRHRLSAFNRSPSGCVWRRVRPNGWVCHFNEMDFWDRVREPEPIYSTRVAPAGDRPTFPPDAELHPEMLRLVAEMEDSSPRFPFDEWNDAMRRARRALARNGRPPAGIADDEPLPPLAQRIELCYQVTNSDAASGTIPALRDALFREGLGVCHVFGSWSAFENEDNPDADLIHPNADAEYRLTCYGELAEIVALIRRVVEDAGRPEVRLYQTMPPGSHPPYRRVGL